MSPPIETVLFDLDGTLVEYEQPADEVLAASFDGVGVEPFFDVSQWYARYEEFLSPGQTVSETRERAFAALADEAGYAAETGRAVGRAYEDVRDHSRVTLLPGATAILDAVAGDYRLGLITNGPPEMQDQKLDGAGIREYFETVVYAGYESPAKPSPEPFYRAFDALDATPEGSVYVGNSLAADVAGANAAGCRSVWVPADPGVRPDPAPDWAVAGLDGLLPVPW